MTRPESHLLFVPWFVRNPTTVVRPLLDTYGLGPTSTEWITVPDTGQTVPTIRLGFLPVGP